MKKNFLAAALLLAFSLLLFHVIFHPAHVGRWHSMPAAARNGLDPQPILLVPLDSRPPCREFVINGGKIIGREIATPPTEYMDYYSKPGNTEAVRRWLSEQIRGASAVILSIDQLLSGGLLAAREAHISDDDIQSLAAYLRTLHAAHPDVPLHAFYILPRAIPQDGIEGWRERRALLAYARLLGRAGAGLPVDESEMERLRTEFPSDDLQKYLAHFDESTALASMLIDLTEEGVLTRLILGQDDGEEYSVGNLKKKELSNLLLQKNIAPERAMIVHGADEIALSMLTRITVDELCSHGGTPPRIALHYAREDMADMIFPFMAVSNDATAREKITMLGGILSDENEAHDLTLFISAGDSAADTLSVRSSAASVIREMLAAGTSVALVDLSRRFHAEETLLPILIEKNVPVNALTAYAGWNTASNAIGTALAQGILYHCAVQRAGDAETQEHAAAANLAFLTGRITEDEFYLKETIDRVNNTLRIAGYTNTADLDLTKNWRWANDLLTSDLTRRIHSYESTAAFRTPFYKGGMHLRVTGSNVAAYYPWPRTFEVRMEARPTIAFSP